MTHVSRYINERFTQPIELAEAAGIAGMSPSAFSRFFKRSSGKGFVEYVNELRIGTACRMLIETDQQIGAIALAVGFSNLSHFNRQFLRAKGVRPLEFRRQFAQTPKHSQPL